jgi:serine/threonine-protein kinase
MGEVYKARDTRLDRTVAIKTIPAELSADPDRRARFEREARAVAALSHPHICTVYDIGAHDGTTYLVMEHLAGESLAQRLTSGPLPVAQALELGAQIADALDAAHKHGIIHRDLKPGNVMLTGEGSGRSGVSSAKLLDFGLAKLVAHGERPALTSDASAPTQTMPMTARGAIVGTLQYMAPEQLEGREADARTDLWALGALVYEMVTGKPAFQADSDVSLIGAILNTEPAGLATLQPLTPPSLERIVKKCLAKHPDDRWDTAHDVADELRWIRETGGGGAGTIAQPRAGRAWRVATLVVAGLVIAGAGLMWLLRPPAPRATVMYKALPVGDADELASGGVSPASVFTPGGSRTALAWTADAKGLVFVGRRNGTQQLYVRRLDAPAAQAINGTEGAQAPAVSRDGVVAFWADGKIKKVPVGGGVVAVVPSGPGLEGPPWGMAWDDLGRLFYGVLFGAIWMVDTNGKAEKMAESRDGELLVGLPHVLPGGRVLTYTVRKRRSTWGDEAVVALTLATRQRVRLLENAADARYVSNGYLVFLRQGQLLAAPFDLETLKTGREVPLLDPVAQGLTAGDLTDNTGAGQFAVSPDGTLAWLPGPAVAQLVTGRLVTVDRDGGKVTPLGDQARSFGVGVRLSPDGSQLAFPIATVNEIGLWVSDLERGAGLTRLPQGGEASFPIWDPNGRRLVFGWLNDGRSALADYSMDGSQAGRVVVPGALAPSSFDKDGRILATRISQGMQQSTVRVSEDNGRASVQVLMETASQERAADVSPDGRWMAYESKPEPTDSWQGYQIFVRSYPDMGRPEQVSFNGGLSPAWNPKTGRELFYAEWRAAPEKCRMMAVDFTPGLPGTRPRIGKARLLFEFDDNDLQGFICGGARCYDVSPDGQRFYAVQAQALPPKPRVTHINLIENFFEVLKTKAPAKK